MSRRFFPLSEPKEGSRFANLSERLNAPLPGEPLYGKNSYEPPLGGTSKRLEAFRKSNAGTSPVALPKATTAPKPTVAPPATPTPAQAAQAAATAAKARHKAVMASAPVKGREKQAGELLIASCKSGSKFGTAEAIITELGKLPFDNQLAAVEKHLKAKASADLWAKAYAKTARGQELARKAEPSTGPKPTEKPMSKSEAMWAKAYAKIAMARGTI